AAGAGLDWAVLTPPHSHYRKIHARRPARFSDGRQPKPRTHDSHRETTAQREIAAHQTRLAQLIYALTWQAWYLSLRAMPRRDQDRSLLRRSIEDEFAQGDARRD